MWWQPAPGSATRSSLALRSNEEWLSALRGSSEVANLALSELRTYVERALAQVTRTQPGLALDDLVQVALLRITGQLERFEGRSQFTTWAYSVALRTAMTEIRRVREDDRRIEEADSLEPDPPVGMPLEAVPAAAPLVRDEIVSLLHRTIDQDLTPRQRTAIVGELRGRTSSEPCDELGTNPGALYKLVHDAKVELRLGLEAAGVSDSDVGQVFDF